jgi:alpha-beta hydrolase superfamily lysophospholipase
VTPTRRRLAWSLAVLVPAAVAITSYGCADRLILPPDPVSHEGDGSTRIEIPFEEGVLEAFVARSPGARKSEPKAFVLRFTGGDANRAARFTASRWRDRPVEAWVVNYPGYGGSSGPRTLRRLADAALRAHDFQAAAAAGRPVYLEGFSLGTVPALHVAANRPAAGLILQNGPLLMDVILKQGWWNLWLVAGPVAWAVPREFDSLANARKCLAPAVILIAEKDRAVLPEIQHRLFAAYAGPKRLLSQPGAGHVEDLDPAEERQLDEGMSWLMNR